jgi:hypothetical protein
MNINAQVERFDEVGYVVVAELLTRHEADQLYMAFEELPSAYTVTTLVMGAADAPDGGRPITRRNERVLLQRSTVLRRDH